MKSLWLARTVAILVLFAFGGLGEQAQAAEDCSNVLVMDTINKTVLSIQNLAIAWSVTEGQWDQIQKNLGADAVIYGIPVGASYSDFQNNVRTMAEAFSMTDFQEYSESYAASQLDSNSVDAYKYCLASQFGLAIFVSDIGNTADASYGIWIVNTPFPNGLPNIKGKITTIENFASASEQQLHNVIDNQDFSLGLNEQLLVKPLDSTKPALLGIAVGNSYSRTLKLPPLVVPKVLTETSNYSPTISACAGYSCGGCSGDDHQTKDYCYNPKHDGAVFVPGSAHLNKTATKGGDASILSASDPKAICVRVQANNTSGCQNTTTASAYITATETYPSGPPQSHFRSNPAK